MEYLEKPKGKIVAANVQQPETRVQIAVLETKTKVFEVNDALSTDIGKHKVNLVIVDHGGAATQIVNHWVNAARMKALCKAILEGRLEAIAGITAEQRRAGKRYMLYQQQKGSKRLNASGYESRIFELWYEPQSDMPYKIKLKSGEGTPCTGHPGAIKMVGDPLKDLFMPMSAMDMYTLASEVLDYIQNWELMHFKKVREGHQVTKVPLGHPWLEEPAPARSSPPLPKEFRSAPGRPVAERRAA